MAKYRTLKIGEYIQETDERSYYTSEGICGGLLIWEQVPPWMIGMGIQSTYAEAFRRLASPFDDLTEGDWLQIEQAANGCVSGDSDEWPALRAAIEKITGKPFALRKPASWLQGFCEGVMIQSGRNKEQE
jgi:hypothetical protein